MELIELHPIKYKKRDLPSPDINYGTWQVLLLEERSIQQAKHLKRICRAIRKQIGKQSPHLVTDSDALSQKSSADPFYNLTALGR